MKNFKTLLNSNNLMMKRFLALKVSTTSVNQYFVGSFMGVQKSIIAASLSQLITRVVTV